MKERYGHCARNCPTPGYLPCSRKENHLGPCAHNKQPPPWLTQSLPRDLNNEPKPPAWVTLLVWILLASFSFLVVVIFMVVFLKVLQ